MLKAEIGGKEDHIQFEGNCLRAVADSTYIIRNLYNHFFCTNQLMADVFKSLVKGCICDDSSPVWQTTGEQGGADGIKSVSILYPKGFSGKEE